MPTYQYRCTECGTDLEAVQKFTDPALTECPTCHGQLRKVFNAVGVVFKGSGFYRTDSRAKEGAPRQRRLEGLGRDQGHGRVRQRFVDQEERVHRSGSNGSGAAPKTERGQDAGQGRRGLVHRASSSS